METTGTLERLKMRCGRIPPPPESTLIRKGGSEDGEVIGFEWNGPRYWHTMPKQDAATCAGYASNLPEVYEAVLGYTHWKHGYLEEWLGEKPTRPYLDALRCIEDGKNQLEFDRIERQKKEAEAERARHGR